MDISRRTFIASSVAGAAMAYAARHVSAQLPPPQFPPEVDTPGEDGSKLWLRYAPVPHAADYMRLVPGDILVGARENSPTLEIIRKELFAGLSGMIGYTAHPPYQLAGIQPGDIVAGTPKENRAIQSLNLDAELEKLGPEGYLIRTVPAGNGSSAIVIASATQVGALYGTYHFLRLIATGQPIDKLNLSEKPAMLIRMADHWDNVNGTIERGYAGRSITFAPDPTNGTPGWSDANWKPNPRLVDYARAMASLGMNGVCINNVNATAAMLSEESLKKVALIADLFRPYGVRVYLSANFSAPVSLAGMATADPNDAAVQKWWKDKAEEIYKFIPNFGGMLVKANSEGQPGPKDYNRSHAEGANCLAAGFAAHNGIVIWRAFVYDDTVDPDRVKRAYKEFMALEGKFLPNVLIQIKNGPLDFQPREPFSPLFGALKQTSFMAEIQPSQEYLGQGKHLVYLGVMWEEFLQSETFAKGPGSTVAKVLEAKVQPVAMTGVAGVLNPGLDTNWTGHHFCQANWFALGRIAWNPELSAKAIAEEWTRLTFTNEPAVINTIVDMMMGSRETFLNYTMPLGLHHMIGGDHYAPMPQNANAQRKDWTAVYYHQADAQGVGFERTRKGDDYVDQYFKPLSDTFDSLETCPDRFLLWFHHLPWDYKMKSGKTLWAEMIEHYDKGLRDVKTMQETWTGLTGKIDARRHKEVSDRLVVQVRDAGVWRNQILGFFSGINKLPVPPAA